MDPAVYDFTTETFETVERQIVAAKDPNTGFTALYITDTDNMHQLGISISLHMIINNITKDEQDVILQIFETARLTD